MRAMSLMRRNEQKPSDTMYTYCDKPHVNLATMADDEHEFDGDQGDPMALAGAIEFIDALIDWWMEPPDERGEMPERPDLVDDDAVHRVWVQFLRNEAQVPRFFALMTRILHGALHFEDPIDRVTSQGDGSMYAFVSFQNGAQTLNVTLDDIAAGDFVPVEEMLQREARIIREQQERAEKKRNDELVAAVGMGLHPRAGRDSSLRRAYNHQLAAKDPLVLALELSGHKPVSEWRGWGNSSSSNNNYSEVKSRAPSNGFVPQTYANSRGEPIHVLRQYRNGQEVQDDTWPQRQPRSYSDISKLSRAERETRALRREHEKRQAPAGPGKRRSSQLQFPDDGIAEERKRQAAEALVRYRAQQRAEAEAADAAYAQQLHDAAEEVLDGDDGVPPLPLRRN